MKSLVFTSILMALFASCNDFQNINKESPKINEIISGNGFCIVLPENHTTGYLWQLSNTYNAKCADYLNAVWHGNEKGIYFNFMAAEKGKTELNFALIKHQDTSEVKTFIIEVK